MYALFFEETHEPIGVFDSKLQALAMGKMLSRERRREVLGILNRADGSAAVCCKFSAGEQTFDGGCCPWEWASAAMETISADKHA